MGVDGQFDAAETVQVEAGVEVEPFTEQVIGEISHGVAAEDQLDKLSGITIRVERKLAVDGAGVFEPGIHTGQCVDEQSSFEAIR